MPKAPARKRPPGRSFEELAGEGLFTRLTDRIIENPAQSGGLAVVGAALLAIISNAAFLQRVHHPDPFFVTRPADDPVPLPKSRAAMLPAALPVPAQTRL